MIVGEVTERPILFSAPMVRSLLDGRKTQTRRIMKPQPHPQIESKFPYARVRSGHAHWHELPDNDFTMWMCSIKCPYGKPGDRLWVKEAMRIGDTGLVYDADRKKIVDIPDGWDGVARRPHVTSMFMPRWASRITLEIAEVRVERLQGISEEDVIAEGVNLLKTNCDGECGATLCRISRQPFVTLWESINGAGSWDLNPWVWAISFKVLA